MHQNSPHAFDSDIQLEIAAGENLGANTENGTHLTVHWSSNVHTENAKYRNNKTGNTGDRVDLSNEKNISPAQERKIKQSADHTTDPDRPTVRSITSKDFPFVVKSNEELPAKN